MPSSINTHLGILNLHVPQTCLKKKKVYRGSKENRSVEHLTASMTNNGWNLCHILHLTSHLPQLNFRSQLVVMLLYAVNLANHSVAT